MSDRLLSQDACQDEVCKLAHLLRATWNELSRAPASDIEPDTIRRVVALIEIGAAMAENVAIALLEDFEAHARDGRA